MIISDNEPRRVPRPSIVPFHWVSVDAATTEAKLAAIELGYSKIPAEIRYPLERKFIHPNIPNRPVQFGVVAAGRDVAWSQYPVADLGGNPDWSGLYLGASAVRPGHAVTTCITTEGANRDRTVVHEFGHHLDTFGGPLLLGAETWSRLIHLNGMELWNFSQLVSPSIPEGVYGKGSPYEWFAEMFARQILEDAEGVINLCGRSEAWATEGRAKFVALIPQMPTVAKPPTVITSQLPPMQRGVPVEYQLEQFGWGHPVAAWSIEFPIPGLTLSADGLLTGTPTTIIGTGATARVRAANAHGMGAYKSIGYMVTA